MAGIGVAVSGGGYRATTWALGALMYLVDSGKNRDVTSIVSVSGGSIANAVVAHEVEFSETDPGQFEEAIRPLLRHIAHEGLFPGPATRSYFAGLITAAGTVGLSLLVLLVAGLVSAVTAATWKWLPWLWLLLIGALAVLLVLVAARSRVVDRALGRVFFTRKERPSRLRDVVRKLDHVFCATELQSADHLYFSPGFIYSYRFGVGDPAELALSTPVQCSACLPGAFRPRRLPSRPHGFRAHPGVVPPKEPPRSMVLSDGGVYDNMADQWQQGFSERVQRWPQVGERHHEADEMVVVNASAGWEWAPLRAGLWRDELAGLRRASSVMYDVTTSHRRQGLVGRFDRAELEGKGLRGALVHIPQSPFRVADAYVAQDRQWPKRAARARRVLDLLGDDEDGRAQWKETARRNADVETVLSKLGEEKTSRLLRHAYVLAMCNLHVILDYPLLDIPPAERFAELLS